MVVKIVRKAYLFSDEERESVCREAHIHATLNHPHIVKLYDAFESEVRTPQARAPSARPVTSTPCMRPRACERAAESRIPRHGEG